jgi:hypothetical protein
MYKIGFKGQFILIVLVALALLPAANGSLLPMSYGFPTMVHGITNTAFNQAFGNSFDLESADIAPMGVSGFGFPMISQSGIAGQAITACEFAQSTEFTAFSYPVVSTYSGFDGFGIWP